MGIKSLHVESILQVMPESPGVYQYFAVDGSLLYIGKAKSLRKRVSSYFSKVHDNARTTIMVRQIADIKYIVVETELPPPMDFGASALGDGAGGHGVYGARS